MKVCANCGEECYGGDKETLCNKCDICETKEQLRRRRATANRKGREQVMRDLGLTKVRGAMGGVYWE